MFWVILENIIDQFPSDTLSLTIEPNTNTKKVDKRHAFLFAESLIDRIRNRKNGIAYYSFSVWLTSDNYFIIGAFPKLFHNESSIRLSTIFKGLLVNKNKHRENLRLGLFGLLD